MHSIAAQTVLPLEVIVVDDGSNDGTADLVRAFSPSMNAIELRVIEQTNQGAGAARNRALEEASGDLIAFLDADDEWLPEKIERSLAVMTETGAGLVSHNYIGVRDGNEQLVDCARHFQGHPEPFISLYLRGNIATSTVLVRRQLIEEAGGFDAGLRSGQDIDLWLAIAGRDNVRFHIFKDALTRYHVTMGSITSRVAERHRCAMIILLRHAKALKGKGGLGKMNALIRTVIVSLQAMAAYRGQGRTVAALGALAYAPLALLRATNSVYSGSLVWLWVGGVTLGYGLQFRTYVDPVLFLFGLG